MEDLSLQELTDRLDNTINENEASDIIYEIWRRSECVNMP